MLNSLPDDRYYVSRDAALDAYGRESLFNVVDFASGWKIDFICRKSRDFSVAESDRRKPHPLSGHSVFVASAEDVILAKLSQSERQLEDAAGIIRIQRAALDLQYISSWVDTLAVHDQWTKAMAIAG